MFKFDPPLWVKPPSADTDIIVFDKSPNQTQADSASGLARFGGERRQPSYLHAYIRSARILFSEGVNTNTLDDICLPIFYLQRHATELILKRLLSWIFSIAELDSELGNPNTISPTKKQQDRFTRSHSLRSLLDDLEEFSNAYKFGHVPASLARLVDFLADTEETETWSRYSSSTIQGVVSHHVEDEHVVPIKNIAATLDLAVSECVLNNMASEEVYEYTLYNEWLTRVRKTGAAG